MDERKSLIKQYIRNKKLNMIQLIVGALVVLLVAGGLYWIATSNRPPAHKKNMAILPGRGTPPPLSNDQKVELSRGISKSTTQKTFRITMGSFYFSPNKITVNQGDKVILVLNNRDGMHDVVIDQFQVSTPVMPPFRLTPVSFIANTKGHFTFYSDTPLDKQNGMKGELVVK